MAQLNHLIKLILKISSPENSSWSLSLMETMSLNQLKSRVNFDFRNIISGQKLYFHNLVQHEPALHSFR